ncbi:apolipoprotein N-acyltransferase [Microbulbifer agarilyticus]|uniref:apolipoprotein N-acyltransferase n=1 Tax=Microbulbifer agarilyticus TaxID=260552 RepID=UPI001CD339C1|nr:apolipoprotein N-acyltransferase [Microbulbifer agarilyticus]MCA0894324.1 apolipoprotein N-acyltransferase [Microbulbifer agarilyticus]
MRKPLPAVAAAIAGGLMTLSFAPYNLWWCGLLSLGLFAWLLAPGPKAPKLSGKNTFWLALCYGVGLFATGGSWVYVSITDFGNSSPLLGVILTGAFVGILAVLLALPFVLISRFRSNPTSFALAFATLWFFSEWLRTWMFTGFPWLFAGYGHIHTWLAGWAPIVSVYGIGLLLAFTAAVMALFARRTFESWKSPSAIALAAVALLAWPLGLLLNNIQWTEASDDTRTIGLVQANIPQEKKWLPEFRGETIRRYQSATQDLHSQGVDVIIWPEAALPLLYHQAPNLIEALQDNALNTQKDLITGILYDTERDHRRVIHNSAAVFGSEQQLYHKRHLVPFGEYVPLEDWIRGTIEFFNLPTSFIRPGPEGQQPLTAGGLSWAPLICYEIVYPQLVAESSGDAQVLLTLSNDAWFGDSIGPLQHMQMAQMRALETRRYLVRGTNTGVTAIVSPDGVITEQLPQFEQATLVGQVQARSGLTPFMVIGIWGLVALATLMLLAAVILQKRPETITDGALTGAPD